MSEIKSSMDKVSGRQLVDGSPVQPQGLRQNQHSAAPKKRQHKILEVLPQGVWRAEMPSMKHPQADSGKKSVISHIGLVLSVFLWSLPFGVGGFFLFCGSIFVKWRICWKLMGHQENCYRASLKLPGFFLLYGQSLPSGTGCKAKERSCTSLIFLRSLGGLFFSILFFYDSWHPSMPVYGCHTCPPGETMWVGLQTGN